MSFWNKYITSFNLKLEKNQLITEIVVNATKALPNYSEQMQKSLNEVLEECKKIKEADRWD